MKTGPTGRLQVRVNPYVFPKIALWVWGVGLILVVVGAYTGQRWMGEVALPLIVGTFVLLGAGLVILRWRKGR